MPKGVKRVRDYSAERARRNAKAREQGFTSLDQRAKFRREQGLKGPAVIGPQAPSALPFVLYDDDGSVMMSVSQARFQAMQIQDMNHSAVTTNIANKNPISKASKRRQAEAIALNSFDEDRVNEPGYVISFYMANVNRATNYESLFRDGHRRIRADGRKFTNKWQRIYMTRYARWNGPGDYPVYSVEDFDQKYGMEVAA